MKPKKTLLFWGSPIIVGALLRLLVILFNPHIPIWDETSFQALAQHLAAGEPYGVPFWPPAWPYLLASIYSLFGRPDHTLGLWSNLLASIATLGLFGLLVNRLFTRTTAVIAIWIMALMPSYIIVNGLLVYEVWLQLLAISVMCLLVKTEWSWTKVAATAVICALITLIRPTWGVMPILLWLMSLVSGYKPPWHRLALMQLGVVILIIPWIVYASRESDRFVPIALQGGLHLWMANNPQATGTHVTPPGEFWDPRNENLARQAAIEFIAEHPTHLVTILQPKLWYMFYADAWARWFFKKTDPVISPTLVQFFKTSSNIYYFTVLVSSILGVALAVYQRRLQYLGPLILFSYGVVAQIALFTGQVKHRWPLQFIIIMYAALTAVWLIARWKKSRESFA